jgi:hypothetical protein
MPLTHDKIDGHINSVDHKSNSIDNKYQNMMCLACNIVFTSAEQFRMHVILTHISLCASAVIETIDPSMETREGYVEEGIILVSTLIHLSVLKENKCFNLSYLSYVHRRIIDQNLNITVQYVIQANRW